MLRRHAGHGVGVDSRLDLGDTRLFRVAGRQLAGHADLASRLKRQLASTASSQGTFQQPAPSSSLADQLLALWAQRDHDPNYFHECQLRSSSTPCKCNSAAPAFQSWAYIRLGPAGAVAGITRSAIRAAGRCAERACCVSHTSTCHAKPPCK